MGDTPVHDIRRNIRPMDDVERQASKTREEANHAKEKEKRR